MRCLECDTEITEIYVNAPATIETIQMVGAEVTFEGLRKDLKHDASGAPYLPLFRLDDRLETRDACVDHHTLELNDLDAEFFCPSCNAILDKRVVWAVVEQKEVEV